MNIKRIGIDLAKNVFQIHAVDEHDKLVFSKRIKRQQMTMMFAQLPPTLIGMEACASAHYWARTLMAFGHEVRLIPAHFVKPYVKSNKNDANDAEAICEALSRPTMRFVAVKSAEQQALQALHKVRHRVTRARTALINEIRGLLGEFGVLIGARGMVSFTRQLAQIIDEPGDRLCSSMKVTLTQLLNELRFLNEQLKEMNRQLMALVDADERITRLIQIEGVGPIVASAIVAHVGDAKQFHSARDFAAHLGIVPRQHSSGGKERLGSISKRGNVFLRTLLIHGARSAVVASQRKHDERSQQIQALVARRNVNIATVAVANKNARIIWSLLTRGEAYRTAS